MPVKSTLDLVKQHEGLRLVLYTDTKGHPTIGYGRALDRVGISEAEAMILLINDLKVATDDIIALFGEGLAEARTAALVDMRFNLGAAGFRKFVKLIAAVKTQNWQTVANEILNSLWCDEVGVRAIRDAELLRTGVWP